MVSVDTSLQYDLLASEYLDYRKALKSGKYLYQLLKYLPKKASILDLGCGAGVPVDDILLKAGHQVWGIDNSKHMIQLARLSCKGASYILGDLRDLKEKEYEAMAVVCLYALFHVPREEHAKLLRTMASFLQPGGMLLLSMGDKEYEGEHLLLGRELWASQYGIAKNIELVRRAGFEIIADQIELSGGERHLFVLARKK